MNLPYFAACTAEAKTCLINTGYEFEPTRYGVVVLQFEPHVKDNMSRLDLCHITRLKFCTHTVSDIHTLIDIQLHRQARKVLCAHHIIGYMNTDRHFGTLGLTTSVFRLSGARSFGHFLPLSSGTSTFIPLLDGFLVGLFVDQFFVGWRWWAGRRRWMRGR